MGKKLYVGNLSYNVSSSDLEQLFTSFGTVESAQVIEDRESGRSKGFGFVEMGNDEEAQKAIQGLNGQEHDGRPLTVNEQGHVKTAVVAAVVVDAADAAAAVMVVAAVVVAAAEAVAAAVTKQIAWPSS